MARDFQQEIVNSIIEKLEQGVKPWVRPWVDGAGVAMPTNLSTKNAYNGINVLLFWMEADAKGYSSNYWLTFKQAKELGGSVRKGEKSTTGIFYKLQTRKNKETGEEETFPIMKPFSAFNLDQIDGIELPTVEAPISMFERHERAEQFAIATGIEIRHGGNSAYYSPSTDHVQMPVREQFRSEADYYATLFHELAHATSAKSRVGRELGRRGTDGYAKEELVAEQSACFLMQHFGIVGECQHESYIASWLKALRGDKKYLFSAASLASKAYDYLAAFDVQQDESKAESAA